MVPDDLVGALAEGLGRVLAHYEDQERRFMEDLFDIWSNIEGLTESPMDRFRWLYYDMRLERSKEYNPPGEERRRPKPFETSIETCRRLMDLNRVRDALAHLPTGGILGGSASYGRFFNVSGATTGKPSDTDLLIVLPSYDHLPEIPASLRTVEGVDSESLAYLQERIRLFPSIRKLHDNCILSHKLKMRWEQSDPYLERYQIPGYYLLSLHIVSWEDFAFIILKDITILQPNRDGAFVREIFDYRDTRPMRFDNQRSFSGIDSTVSLEAEPVEGGHISRIHVCHIHEDRFYPGLHQNLILPQFELRWESASRRLYLSILGFRWKILERLREERKLRPFELQKVSLSHTRSAVFSPHIRQRADRE